MIFQKKKLLISLLLFVSGLLFNTEFSTLIHYLLSRKITKLELINFITCIQSIASSKNHLMLFLYYVIIVIYLDILKGRIGIMKLKKIFFVLIIGILMLNTCVFAHEKTFKSKTEFMDTKVKSRDYADYFWTDNSDGEILDIYIKNNGNQPVQHRITHGKDTVRSKGTIKPGQKVQLRLGPDRSGKWTIDVYTTDGSKMNVEVQARQWTFYDNINKKDLDNIIKENKELKEKLNIANKKIEKLTSFLK